MCAKSQLSHEEKEALVDRIATLAQTAPTQVYGLWHYISSANRQRLFLWAKETPEISNLKKEDINVVRLTHYIDQLSPNFATRWFQQEDHLLAYLTFQRRLIRESFAKNGFFHSRTHHVLTHGATREVVQRWYPHYRDVLEYLLQLKSKAAVRIATVDCNNYTQKQLERAGKKFAKWYLEAKLSSRKKETEQTNRSLP